MNDRDREEARLQEIRRRARELSREPAGGDPMRQRREAERGSRVAWSPRPHVFDRDGTMIVRFELPGLDRKDVEVRVEDQVLVVEGERQDDRPHDGGPRSDWGYGPFRCEIGLPQSVDPSDVTGSFRNGMLEVAVPKPRREERRQRIKVEAV